MVEKILILIWNWIGYDSKIYLFLESTYLKLWPSNIEIWISLLILWLMFYILYILFYTKYKKLLDARWSRRVSNFWEYIDREKYKLLLTIAFSFLALWYFFSYWLWIEALWIFTTWIWYDWTNYQWLSFLFWYNLESKSYQYYNTWRYLVLILILTTTIYNWVMYYTVWEREKLNWNKTSYQNTMKIWLTTIAIMLFLLFSTFPDAVINDIYERFNWSSLHDSTSWWYKL